MCAVKMYSVVRAFAQPQLPSPAIPTAGVVYMTMIHALWRGKQEDHDFKILFVNGERSKPG